jgi:two-component system response regulator TctD
MMTAGPALMRLLLIEDTPRLRDLLVETVHAVGWRIDAFGTVADGEAAVATTSYDLLLIDLGLPDGDGLELIRALRARGVHAPILALTARAAIDERIAGLDAGADDYLVKPFNHGEFLARCRALLRRAPGPSAPILTAGQLVFDPATGALTCGGEEVSLTPRERAVAEILMREIGRTVLKRKLEHALSEFGDDMLSNAIELVISRLRKKLAAYEPGAALETIRGLGYLMRELTP